MRNWLAREVSFSMRFPGHETASIGNRLTKPHLIAMVCMLSQNTLDKTITAEMSLRHTNDVQLGIIEVLGG